MGSSFSIVNDTDKPIWVSDGVCEAALWGTIGGVLALVTVASAAAGGGAAVGDGAAAAAAAAAFGKDRLLSGAIRLTATEWAAVGTVSGLLAFKAGTVAGLSGEDEQKVLLAKKELKKKLKGFKRIEPGCKHTVKGSLSLVWTAYVLYDDGRQAKKNCWTGATADSENLYPVSQYFKPVLSE